jgi:hypothetical protein
MSIYAYDQSWVLKQIMAEIKEYVIIKREV